jgi:hypothetical protein
VHATKKNITLECADYNKESVRNVFTHLLRNFTNETPADRKCNKEKVLLCEELGKIKSLIRNITIV